MMDSKELRDELLYEERKLRAIANAPSPGYVIVTRQPVDTMTCRVQFSKGVAYLSQDQTYLAESELGGRFGYDVFLVDEDDIWKAREAVAEIEPPQEAEGSSFADIQRAAQHKTVLSHD